MAELARLAQGAIARRDRSTILRCSAFAARALETGTPAIQNAVSVSFLEHTLLETHGVAEREAESLLPPSLQADLVALREYWAELRGRSARTSQTGRTSKRVRSRRTRR